MRTRIKLWMITLLTLALILPLVPTAAAEASTAAVAVTALQKRGILAGDYEASDAMTRGQWAHVLAGLFSNMNVDPDTSGVFGDVTPDTAYAADINKLYVLGIFKGNGDGGFEPEEAITETQAEILLLRLLGYETALNLSADRPESYHTVANRLKLYQGVSDEMLLSDCLVVMLYNALDAQVMEQVRWNSAEYIVNPDETLMNNLLDVYEYTGVVQGVGAAAVSPAYATGETQVWIGGELFTLDESADVYEFIQYLGMPVRAYYRNSRGEEPRLLFCTEYGSVSVIKFSLSDLLSVDGNTMEYTGAAGRTERITFDPAAYLVYNNRPAESIPELGKNGNVRIIRNGLDYDCVIITEYRTCVVDFVSMNNQVIVGLSGRVEMENLEDTDSYRIFDANHDPVDISILSQWDVLTVAASADGSFVEMYLSREKISGTIGSIVGSSAEEYRIQILDTEYQVTQEFYEENHEALKPGDTGRIYFDIFGRIAAFDKGQTTGPQLGYLINARNDMGSFGKQFQVKLLTQNGGVQIYDVKTSREQFKLNDQSVSVDRFLTDNLQGGVFNRQVIRYTMNGDGQVSSIETVGGGGEEGLYEVSVGTSAYFRSNQLSFNSYAMGAADTVVFLVPSQENADNNEAYSAANMNYFTSGINYRGIQAYGLGKTRLTAAALVWEREDSSYGVMTASTGMGVLLSFQNTWNSQTEEIRQGMSVMRSGTERTVVFPEGVDLTTTTMDPSVMNTPTAGSIPSHAIERGDVIRYSTSSETGEVGYLQLLYDRSEKQFLPSSNPLIVSSGSYKVGTGNVLRRDDSVLEIQYGGAEINYYNVSASTYIVTVTEIGGEISVQTGSLDDIRTVASFPDNPSTVFIHSTSGVPQSIIIYNE